MAIGLGLLSVSLETAPVKGSNMNSININGVGNLSSLRGVACANYAAMSNEPENSVPNEQHDMVSLGQDTPDMASADVRLNGISDHSFAAADKAAEASRCSSSAAKTHSPEVNNDMRATLMNDLGVLTMLDDPSIEAVGQINSIDTAGSAELQNTLAMVNINGMDSILQNGLIAFGE